jgi:hypothetical protein
VLDTQASVEDLALVTADPKIRSYPIEAIWSPPLWLEDPLATRGDPFT